VPEASRAATTPAAACAWCGRPLPPAPAEGPAHVAVCPSCGAGTTLPRPTDADLDAAYGTWYRPAEGRFSGVGDRVLRRSRGALARRLDRRAPAGPILDVGSGDGVLLDALHAAGRAAEGLERESTRADVRAGRVDDVEGGWSAIVFWHSLEHLRAPTDALRAAAARLRPGGLLVIAIPNFGSLQAAAFGARWFALDLPRHLVHVPARSLLSLLREEGLHVERVSQLRGGQVVFGWLQGLVGLLPSRPDLYDAIRRPDARRRPLGPGRRAAIVAAAAVVWPVAVAAAGIEALLRRGGSVYVEARRPTGNA
jgi:SAM-dependent methyltransferase